MLRHISIAALITAVFFICPSPTFAETPTAAKPPELIKLEAEAAVAIPVPAVPAGRAPEVKRVAETSVAVARATWVVEKLLPPPPEGMSTLKLSEMKIGNTGWVDVTAEVVKSSEGVAVVRPSIAPNPDFTLAIPVSEGVTVPRVVSLRGEYKVEKAVTVDGKDVLLLKEVSAAKALEPAVAKVIDVARRRLEEAKADYAQAMSNLLAARQKAEKAVLERAQQEARKKLPVPKDATAEEQIKVQRDQDELARKLAAKELEKIEATYSYRQ